MVGRRESLVSEAALLVALFVLGCGAEAGGASDSDESKQVRTIDGTATAARLEVAQWGSDLAGCVATLITPQYAVTAAHCNYGLPATVRNSTFQGIAVQDVWIFGAGPEVESDPGNFNQDVMLMKLASPTTGFTPARISTRWAKVGETVTLVGYGPTNPGCSTGGGTKNYRTFSLDTTNHVCPGDSGGPMFLGRLAANGDLVAVTSSPNAPKESYGDVVMFREDIASVMRFWDEGYEVGIDRRGGDLAGMPVASPSAVDCKTKCRANTSCIAFTWVNSGWCYQKRVLAPWSVNANCTSGLVQQATEKLEANTDRMGGDFRTLGATVSACRTACAKDARCKAFTQYNGTCYLKAYVPAATILSGATSGVRVPPSYSQVRSGTSIAEIDLDSQLPHACAAKCASNANCASYGWRRPLIALKAHCSLFSNNPAPSGGRMEYATQDNSRAFY